MERTRTAGTGGDSGSGANGSGAASSGGSDSASGGRASGSGGLTSTTECLAHAHCTMVAATCCGTCGEAQLDDLVGLHVEDVDDYRDSVCADNPICPACAELPRDAHLFDSCDAGTCQAHDLRTHEWSSCATLEDCVLIPKACCACNASTDPSNVVAVNKQHAEDFAYTQCEQTPLCDECAWTPPVSVQLSCEAGHCRAVLPITIN